MKRCILVVMISLWLVVGCGPFTKKQFIHDHEHFVAQVASDFDTYEEEDWVERNEQMREFWEESYPKFEDELSLEEKTDLSTDAMRYYLYQYRDRTLQMIEETDEEHLEIIKENMRIATEAGVDFADEMIPYFEEMLPEMEALANKLQRKFESKQFQDQLKKSLEKLQDRLEDMEEVYK
ncbi:MAG: DUF6565 domain-containing protein [Bacteroidota bacterium]